MARLANRIELSRRLNSYFSRLSNHTSETTQVDSQRKTCSGREIGKVSINQPSTSDKPDGQFFFYQRGYLRSEH